MGAGPIAGDGGIIIGAGAGALIGGIGIGAGARALIGGITGAGDIGSAAAAGTRAAMGMGAGSGPMSELCSLRPKMGNWKPSAAGMAPGSGPGAGATIGDIIIDAGVGALIGGIVIGAGAGASMGDIIQDAGAGASIGGGIIIGVGAGALMGMGAGSGPMSELCSFRPETGIGKPSADEKIPVSTGPAQHSENICLSRYIVLVCSLHHRRAS